MRPRMLTEAQLPRTCPYPNPKSHGDVLVSLQGKQRYCQIEDEGHVELVDFASPMSRAEE